MGSIDYEQLHGLLWEAISEAETEITAQALAFAQQFTKQLKQDKYVLTEEDKAKLQVYITSQYQVVRQAVEAAIRPTIQASGASANMVDALTRQAADVAFQRRWPDGLDLSKRLWTWGNDTEQGIFDQLRKGIRASAGASKLMYDLQFLLEQDKQAFEIVADDFPKWIDDVERWAKAATISPDARREWVHRVVPEIERKATKMAENGTKRAVEQFIRDMKTAVDKGRVDLIDRSVQWWVYEKQLYDLKRITRTELSTAQHNAVIDTTQDDVDIIGYEWRLSFSHPRPDVCDFLAHIDFGLGQGVFPKESVPRRKAHPHCVLGNTCVTALGTIIAATKATYQGRVIEIITASGKRLSCTTNHMILTTTGWVAAQFLHQGQQIAIASGSQWESSGVNPDNDNRPSMIEQIFNSALKSLSMTSISMPASTEYFHGDGRFMDGNVEIVDMHGFLLGEDQSSHAQSNGQFIFNDDSPTKSLLFSDGRLRFPSNTDRDSSNRLVGGGSHVSPELCGSITQPQRLRLSERTDLNSLFSQDPDNDIAGDMLSSSKVFDGFTGLITLDEIVKIREQYFSGHVFDLQVEPQQWYIANGIITHNCMCLLIPRVTTIKKKGEATYADFLKSAPANVRNEIMPVWMRKAEKAGLDLNLITRPGGFSFMNREQAKPIAAQYGIIL